MSQFQAPPSTFNDPQQQPSQGLAIGALITSLFGCIPLVGIVGAILGIVAYLRTSREPQRYAGAGMAIAAIVIGCSLTLLTCSMGVMLPALGKARQAARQLKSATQMRQIVGALSMYAPQNRGFCPEAGAD